MQIFRVYVCKNQIFIAAHIQTGAFLITHHSPVVGCVTLNTNPQYFHLDIFNVLMLIFCRWCVRRYERFFFRNDHQERECDDRGERGGCMFHFTQLEKSLIREIVSLTVMQSLGWGGKRKKHLERIAIMRRPKSQIISTLIRGYYIILIRRPAPGGTGSKCC